MVLGVRKQPLYKQESFLIHPFQEDAIPHETAPCGIPRHRKADRVQAGRELSRVHFILNEPPLPANPAGAVEGRVVGQDVLVQRPQKLPVDIHIQRQALRVAGNRQAEERRPVVAVRHQVLGGDIEGHRPGTRGGDGIVPVGRLVGLADIESQVRGAEARDVELVRQAAVGETGRLLVKVPQPEDGGVALGQLPRDLPERRGRPPLYGDGREGDVGVDVGDGAAVGPGVEAIVARADVGEGEGAVLVRLGGVVVVGPLDERPDGGVGVPEEDGGAGCRASIAEGQGACDISSRLVGRVVEPGVGEFREFLGPTLLYVLF